MGYLVIIDRSYRGSAESQFFDAFYGVLNLSASVGDVQVVLRGNAVTAALDPEAGGVPDGGVGVTDGGGVPDGGEVPDGGGYLWPGGAGPDALPDPRGPVRAMLAAGITTYADEPSLRAFRLDADALLPGVTCLDTTGLAARWAEYDGVWFL